MAMVSLALTFTEPGVVVKAGYEYIGSDDDGGENPSLISHSHEPQI